MFKTTAAKAPSEYIAGLTQPRQNQIQKLHEFIVQTVPRLKPYIISGMLGYGAYHYKYASGRQGDWCIVGLASQKNYISLYVCAVRDGAYIAEGYRDQLPKASIGKSCIRFKKLEDIDFAVIEKILKEAEKSPAYAI